MPQRILKNCTWGGVCLTRIVRLVRLIQSNTRGKGHSFRVLCTMVRKNVNLSREVEGAARESFGDRVYRTTIPENVKLAEAPAAGKPITFYDPECAGALAYRALAEEIDNG